MSLAAERARRAGVGGGEQLARGGREVAADLRAELRTKPVRVATGDLQPVGDARTATIEGGQGVSKQQPQVTEGRGVGVGASLGELAGRIVACPCRVTDTSMPTAKGP